MVAECEGIVHLAPESRQRWMLAPSGFPHLVWTPVYGMVFSHSGWVIPPKLSLSETPPLVWFKFKVKMTLMLPTHGRHLMIR